MLSKIYFSFWFFLLFGIFCLASDKECDHNPSLGTCSTHTNHENLDITYDSLSDRYIQSIKEIKGVSVRCNLSNFRPVNMDSLGYYLDLIDQQNNISVLTFENGTSQKFNLFFETLYNIYMRHYKNDLSISIYFHTPNHRTRAPEKLQTLPGAISYISFEGHKTVRIDSPVLYKTTPENTQKKIINFGTKSENKIFREEIEQFIIDNPWNFEKYGSSKYFGIDADSLIFETILTGNEAISELSEWVARDSNIKVINLSQSNIENEDLVNLKSLLVRVQGLVILDLSLTTLNLFSFADLIEILKNNSNLKFINVCNTDFFDDYLTEGVFPKFLRLFLNERIDHHPLVEKLIWLDVPEEKCDKILRTLHSMDDRLPVEKILENHMLYYQLDTYINKIVEKNKIIESIKSVRK